MLIVSDEIHQDFARPGFTHAVAAAGYSQPNTLGLVATQAAYEHGGEWLDQLKDYLEGNWALLEEQLQPYEGRIHLVGSESTHLAWIDCRGMGLLGDELRSFVENEAGLWLDLGDMFGADGEGFIRINIATQRSYLRKALKQLTDALNARIARSCAPMREKRGSATHLTLPAREPWQCHNFAAGYAGGNTTTSYPLQRLTQKIHKLSLANSSSLLY